jgi:hypothetical protein
VSSKYFYWEEYEDVTGQNEYCGHRASELRFSSRNLRTFRYFEYFFYSLKLQLFVSICLSVIFIIFGQFHSSLMELSPS